MVALQSMHVEMNKQVETVDIFRVSGVYAAFLRQCHLRTSRCFPDTPQRFVCDSAVPLSSTRQPLVLGGWHVRRVKWGVSKPQAAFCPLRTGNSEWLP